MFVFNARVCACLSTHVTKTSIDHQKSIVIIQAAVRRWIFCKEKRQQKAATKITAVVRGKRCRNRVKSERAARGIQVSQHRMPFVKTEIHRFLCHMTILVDPLGNRIQKCKMCIVYKK